MLKMSSKKSDGRSLYVFGLSHTNLDRLRKGEPIQLALEPLGGTGEVLIVAGETEATIAQQLGVDIAAAITDLQICLAVKECQRYGAPPPHQLLMQRTGLSAEQCIDLLYRASRSGYVIYDGSVKTGGLTSKGHRLIRDSKVH